jgi:UDP-N-acetylglucosamine--N-acetylmuramyl-(pentapeptide) pyrophosphoryl-undecaprenol N-acetylglucosamine transferase
LLNPAQHTFVMAGGGTGGHVVPALAVAGELRRRGHRCVFIGTRRGMEATLVPRAGFAIEWIEIGGLQRVGLWQQFKTLCSLPFSTLRSLALLRKLRAAAVFSMGGYVAAPVMFAASLSARPIVVMEPNALPGLVTRQFARRVERALLNFPETQRFFPAGRAELTGMPVREEFFALPSRPPHQPFSLLVTGGSRGSRTLNQAARDSWPLFRAAPFPVRFVLQCGAGDYDQLARAFNESGLDGEVTRFIHDMPAAYDAADLIVSRAGAGAVSELAAAGKPSVLVPFPFAADDHQRHNAEAMVRGGAALLSTDAAWTGPELFRLASELRANPARLEAMSRAARAAARPGAALRAADLLEACAASPAHPSIDTASTASKQ